MAAWGDFHSVNGAGWSLFWRLPDEGGGLQIWWADFQGKRVLWKASQPFAIVPYHFPLPAGAQPGPPESTFKDGLGAQCEGAPFTPLKQNAPNADLNGDASWEAVNDTQAVEVHVEPGGSFGPEVLVIEAKLQCGWYQYVHRWSFDSYGQFDADLGMGGAVNPGAPRAAHVHHMYFRIDLDIDGFSSDAFEVFNHKNFDDNTGGDAWSKPIPKQGKFKLKPASARKFRVRDLTSALPDVKSTRSYEIEIPALAGTDTHSTADVWATVYRGDNVEQGADVSCFDTKLDTYATGPFDTNNGSDIVLWVVVRHHHEPRNEAEERNFLPYHYEGFHIVHRAFAALKGDRKGGRHG